MPRSLRSLLCSLLITAGLFGSSAPVNAQDTDPFAGRWTSRGAGPSHSGFYPVTIGDVTVTPGWTKSFDGQPVNQVVVADGRVVVTANPYIQSSSPHVPFVAALNSSTGQELWRNQMPKFFAGPTINSNYVFLQNTDSFTTLNVADGSVLWERPIASFTIFPAPVSLGDRVWAASTNGVYSVRISDNSLRYFTRAVQPYYGTALSYYDGVLYGMDAGNFWALDPDTGVRLWMFPLTHDSTGAGTPAVAGNQAAVLIPNRLVIMDLETRLPRWSVVDLFSGGLANDGSTVYVAVGLYPHTLNAYDTQTGALRGHYEIPLSGDSLPSNFQPLVTNDLVMIGSNQATYIFDKATFQLRTKLNVGGYLSFCGGVLYVADDAGNLSTFEFATAQGERVPQPWPTATPVPIPLVPNRVELVTANYQGTAATNTPSHLIGLSKANGRYVLFNTAAADLTAVPDDNKQTDLFLRDLHTGTTQLVTVNYAGTAASGPPFTSVGDGQVSADGRFVVFTAFRTDLVPEGGTGSVYIRDMVAGKTSLVSVGPDGRPRRGSGPQVSADGRFVVFASTAQDLVPGHSGGPSSDVYVRDMVANTTQLVSIDSGDRGQGDADAITMTRDGRYVLYWAATTTSQESRQLFLRDLLTGGKAQITLNTNGVNPKDGTFEPASARVSEDGRYVTFDSSSTDLVIERGGYYNVFIRDVAAGSTMRLGVWDPIADNRLCDVSADGQVVAFTTYLSNGSEINIYDRRKGTIEPLSPAGPGSSGGGAAQMDRTGRFVVFEGSGANIGFDNGNNSANGIFVIDRQLHTARLLSHNLSGSPAGGTIHFADGAVISDDGQTVVFESNATDLTLLPTPQDPHSSFSQIFAAIVPSSGRLLNISTRADVLPGDNALIAGFVLSGADPKKVIIRAIGPSLAAAGLTGVLDDPTLDLYDGAGSLIASNDNWKESAAEVSATGLAPSHDFESALVRNLEPGSYTAVVRGKSGASGIGSVELYDLGQPGECILANISTRAFIRGGDDVLIAGFIAGGDGGGASRVLIRGIGPSLAGFGVSGALPDPVLDLYDSNGSRVKTNDDWKQTERGEIEATGIVPANDAESAILYTLAPGSYTTIVTGKGASGIGLVEVYNLR
jgi:Tol biopolymer transport system component